MRPATSRDVSQNSAHHAHQQDFLPSSDPWELRPIHDIVHWTSGAFQTTLPHVVHPNPFWSLIFARAIAWSEFGVGTVPGIPFRLICRFLGNPRKAKTHGLHRILWQWGWLCERLALTCGLASVHESKPLLVCLPYRSSHNKCIPIAQVAAICPGSIDLRLTPLIAQAHICGKHVRVWRRIILSWKQFLPRLQTGFGSLQGRQHLANVERSMHALCPRIRGWRYKRES